MSIDFEINATTSFADLNKFLVGDLSVAVNNPCDLFDEISE